MSDRPQGEPEQAKMWSAFLKDDPNGLTVLLSFVRLRAVFESGELFNPDGATLRNREEGMNAFFELGMDLKYMREFAVKHCSTDATEEKLDAFFEFQRIISPLEDRLKIILEKITEQYRWSSNPLPNREQQLFGFLPQLVGLLNCLKFYEPSFYELLNDFMLKKRECKTQKDLRSLTIWFNGWKVVLFLGSLKALVVDKIERVTAWIFHR